MDSARDVLVRDINNENICFNTLLDMDRPEVDYVKTSAVLTAVIACTLTRTHGLIPSDASQTCTRELSLCAH